MLPDRLAETSDIRRKISQTLGGKSDGAAKGSGGASKGKGKARDGAAAAAAAAAKGGAPVDSMDVEGAENDAKEGRRDSTPPALPVPGEAAAEGSEPDVHSVTAQSMLRCWNAVGERLAAARKVVTVTEVGMPSARGTAAAAAAGGREEGERRLKPKKITKGPRGMRTGAGGAGARGARKVGPIVLLGACSYSYRLRLIRYIFL